MELNYIVIDDVQSDIDRLVREADKTRELRFADSYNSAYEALAKFRLEGVIYPVIFCDIRLREENGLDAGPELAKYCKYLVFVTGLTGQKGKVLDARGDDHLQKPVSCDQIRTRVLDRFYKRHGDELPMYIHLNKLYIYHTHEKKHYPEKLKDIKYISHEQNYLTVAVKSGKVYTIRAKISHAFSLLEPAGIFVQVNRGEVINMKFMRTWDWATVWIDDVAFKLLGAGKKAFFDYMKRNKLGDGGFKGKN